MNGHNLDFEPNYPVLTDWNDLSNCPFARKCWVNPSNVNEEKSYEKGDFLRVYCDHDDAEFGYDNCVICTDHLNE